MKYQCVLLGHSPELIQSKLATMDNCRIVGVTSIGVNVIAITENPERQWIGPRGTENAGGVDIGMYNTKEANDATRRNHRKG